MQLIESTPFGVRSAYRILQSGQYSPIVHLFPMVHIGDAGFYDDVYTRASNMDLVLTEGVKTTTSRWITSSYRMLVKNPKFGLVVQPTFPTFGISANVINIDVSASTFKEKWKSTTLFTRFGFPVLAAFFGLYATFVSNREELAKYMGQEFSRDREDILNDSKTWIETENVILHWRDKKITEQIDHQIQINKDNSLNIAIIYGAAHMRAIIKYLMDQRDYKVKDSIWLDLIKL